MKCVKLNEPDTYGDAQIVRRPDLLAQALVEGGSGTFTTKNAWRAYEKRLHGNMRRTSMLIQHKAKQAKKAERLRQRGNDGTLHQLRGNRRGR